MSVELCFLFHAVAMAVVPLPRPGTAGRAGAASLPQAGSRAAILRRGDPGGAERGHSSSDFFPSVIQSRGILWSQPPVWEVPEQPPGGGGGLVWRPGPWFPCPGGFPPPPAPPPALLLLLSAFLPPSASCPHEWECGAGRGLCLHTKTPAGSRGPTPGPVSPREPAPVQLRVSVGKPPRQALWFYFKELGQCCV